MSEVYIRYMTVTEFSIAEFQDFKSGKQIESPPKLKAMQMLAKEEKSPRSALLDAGGIANVRRVIVLREASDTSPDIPTMCLKYDWKVPPREDGDRAFHFPLKPRPPIIPRKPGIPITIPNTDIFVTGVLRLAISELKTTKEYSREFGDQLLLGLLELRNKIDSNNGLDLKLAAEMLPEVNRLMSLYTAPAVDFTAPINVKMPAAQWQYIYLDVIRATLSFMFYLGHPKLGLPIGNLPDSHDAIVKLAQRLGFPWPPG